MKLVMWTCPAWGGKTALVALPTNIIKRARRIIKKGRKERIRFIEAQTIVLRKPIENPPNSSVIFQIIKAKTSSL